MRCTNLHLDDGLIERVLKIGKFKTKKDAVNAALQEYVAGHGRSALIEPSGKINDEADYDDKKLRTRRKSNP